MNYTCTSCNGRGTVPVMKMDGEGRYQNADETCSNCHGAGYVWKADPAPGDNWHLHND